MRSCILLACSSDQSEQCQFIASRLFTRPDPGFDLVIASDAAVDPFVLKDKIRTVVIDPSAFKDGLPQLARFGSYCYWRIPAIEAMSGDYDRILYLDTDVFINSNEIAQIFSMDMQGATLAAVRDVHQRERPSRMPNEFRALGLGNAPYFNSGVMLIDAHAWREGRVFDRLAEIASRNAQTLSAHDQSLFNIAFHNDWLELSPTWNWQYSPRNRIAMDKVRPRLIHFAGGRKPWHPANGEIPRFYWEAYREFRKRHGRAGGDWRYPALSTSAAMSIAKAVLKSIWYLRATWRNLRRFDSGMAAIRHTD